jgi:segregation and condensation protein B
MATAEGPPDQFDRADYLFALLFVAGEPVAEGDLARWLNVPAEAVPPLIETLARRLGDGPLTVRAAGGGFRLVLTPSLTAWVAAVQGGRAPETLTPAQWECLAVVAYRQPVTRLEVEALRQAQSEHALDALVRRGLIEEVGRKPVPGRPILYGTTRRFLEIMGVDRLDQLPPPPAGAQTPAAEVAGTGGDPPGSVSAADGEAH